MENNPFCEDIYSNLGTSLQCPNERTHVALKDELIFITSIPLDECPLFILYEEADLHNCALYNGTHRGNNNVVMPILK